MKKLLAVILIAASSSSYADDWELVSINDKNNFAYLINIDSVERDGSTVIAWAAGINVDPKVSHDLHQALVSYDCKKKATKRLHLSVYLKGNKVGHDYPSDQEYQFVPPGTIAYHALKQVCKDVKVWSVDFKGSPFDIVKPVQNMLREEQKLAKSKH